VAVLAGGLDSTYPIDHHRLAQKIIEQGGALLSEYPPLSRPKPYRFPVRNRIIAGLSPVSLIVEAKIQSGSLTTARSALDYNREVWAVPGDITRKLAEGANHLIKDGATLIDSPKQIAQHYGLQARERAIPVDKTKAQLLELLTSNPESVEQLLMKTNLTTPELLRHLTELELAGLIIRDNTGLYARVSQKW